MLYRWARRLPLVLALALMLLNGTARYASAYNYLGSGYWFNQTTVWVYRYATGDYSTAGYNAQSNYTGNTHVYLADTSEGYEDIGIQAANYGNTNWYMDTAICTTGGCSGNYNYQYTYATVRANQYFTDSWSLQKKQAGYAHELGHALSLDHNNCCQSYLMYWLIGYFYDVYGTYGVTSDEISGINGRY